MPKFGNTSVSSSKPSISKCQTFTCFLRGARVRATASLGWPWKCPLLAPDFCQFYPKRSHPRGWRPDFLHSPIPGGCFPSRGGPWWQRGRCWGALGVRNGTAWCHRVRCLLLCGGGSGGMGGLRGALASPCALGGGIKPAVVFCLCSAPSLQSPEVSLPGSSVPVRLHGLGAAKWGGEGGGDGMAAQPPPGWGCLFFGRVWGSARPCGNVGAPWKCGNGGAPRDRGSSPGGAGALQDHGSPPGLWDPPRVHAGVLGRTPRGAAEPSPLPIPPRQVEEREDGAAQAERPGQHAGGPGEGEPRGKGDTA